MLLRLISICFVALTAWAGLVDDVRVAMSKGNFALAGSLVESYRAQQGATPEFIEAVSWLGRGALATKQLDQAEAYAKQTQKLVAERLAKQPLDSDEHLATALGAAIEVEGQVLNQRGGRSQAVAYLRGEFLRYGRTSIAERIQKNINLLSLEGSTAPPLVEREFFGPKPPALASLRGKPVLLFFWAHWCSDCKAEEPILAQIQKEYAAKGLVLIAPTRRYGYTSTNENVSPADEMKYIDAVRQRFYVDLLTAPAPVSDVNFKNYGASTTPTVVLVDRRGIVRLYHPGAMKIEELRAALDRLG